MMFWFHIRTLLAATLLTILMGYACTHDSYKYVLSVGDCVREIGSSQVCTVTGTTSYGMTVEVMCPDSNSRLVYEDKSNLIELDCNTKQQYD